MDRFTLANAVTSQKYYVFDVENLSDGAKRVAVSTDGETMYEISPENELNIVAPISLFRIDAVPWAGAALIFAAETLSRRRAFPCLLRGDITKEFRIDLVDNRDIYSYGLMVISAATPSEVFAWFCAKPDVQGVA